MTTIEAETKLTALTEGTEMAILGMYGKALCSYANARETFKVPHTDPRFDAVPQSEVMAALNAEYEATVRCLDMLVKENIYEIQSIIRKAAAEKFGL